MKILILTSADHLYANMLLRGVYSSGVLDNSTVLVWEQQAIIPGLSQYAGLVRYIKRAGFGYVLPHMVKQTIFVLLRGWVRLVKKRNSIFYPYWVSASCNSTREQYGHIKSDEAYRRVRKFRPDIILSVFSKEIIPGRVLQTAKIGAVNVHPALLPKFRGISPIFWAMSEGKRTCGITLHELDTGIDTGRILSQKMLRMHKGESEHSVYLRLAKEGVDLVCDYLQHAVKKIKPNNTAGMNRRTAAYYSVPTKEAVRKLYQNGYTLMRCTELIRDI